MTTCVTLLSVLISGRQAVTPSAVKHVSLPLTCSYRLTAVRWLWDPSAWLWVWDRQTGTKNSRLHKSLIDVSPSGVASVPFACEFLCVKESDSPETIKSQNLPPEQKETTKGGPREPEAFTCGTKHEHDGGQKQEEPQSRTRSKWKFYCSCWRNWRKSSLNLHTRQTAGLLGSLISDDSRSMIDGFRRITWEEHMCDYDESVCECLVLSLSVCLSVRLSLWRHLDEFLMMFHDPWRHRTRVSVSSGSSCRLCRFHFLLHWKRIASCHRRRNIN